MVHCHLRRSHSGQDHAVGAADRLEIPRDARIKPGVVQCTENTCEVSAFVIKNRDHWSFPMEIRQNVSGTRKKLAGTEHRRNRITGRDVTVGRRCQA